MGEEGDGDSKPRRQRLLSRFTRSRNEQDEQAKDVVDFLRPSTDKAAALPRINVAVAQRFPTAQRLPIHDASQANQADRNVPRKRRRREGLKVHFVDTPPEIIGEGGDEAQYPTIEYGPHRAGLSRHSHEQHDWYPTDYRAQHQGDAKFGADRYEDNVGPQQSTIAYPVSERTSNGQWTTKRIHEDAGVVPLSVYDQSRRSGTSPVIATDRRRAMRVNEGMALRRGSAFMDDLDEDDETNDNDIPNDDHDPPPHFPPHDKTTFPGYQVPSFSQHQLDARFPQAMRPRTTSQHSQEANAPKQLAATVPERKQQWPTSGSTTSQPPPQQAKYPGQAQYRAYKPSALETPAHNEPRKSLSPARHTGDSVAGASMDNKRQQSRPSSVSSNGSNSKPADITSAKGQPGGGELALTDFATRVAHMKGVFALTAERERPAESCTAYAWLRTACWWYLEGKIELEQALRRRARSSEPPRELLLQGHVDLAKAWWILTNLTAQRQQDRSLQNEYGALLDQLQTLCLSIGRSRIMPPPASLIQGQDTRIWLDYPHPDTVVQAVLGDLQAHLSPTQALPLGDTSSIFCYNRFRVHVTVGQNSTSQSAFFPCLLSVVRDTQTFQNSIIVASQNELVDLVVGASDGGVDWRAVEWDIKGNVLFFRADANNIVAIYLQEHDFRLLRSMIDYTRKAVDMLRPENGENPTFRSQILSVLYQDSAKSRIFPKDRVKDCQVCVFEKDGPGETTRRLAIVTSPSTKILSCVNHQLPNNQPQPYETFVRQDGSAIPALQLSLHDDSRTANIQLEFGAMSSMHDFCAAISGCRPSSQGGALTRLRLTAFVMETLATQASTVRSQPDPLKLLDWMDVTVLAESISERSASGQPVAGCIRLALEYAGGFMLAALNETAQRIPFHLPFDKSQSIELLCGPQAEVSAAFDQRLIHPGMREAISVLFQDLRGQSTIRTVQLNNQHDLHIFQASVLGCDVIYDGTPSSFIVARRKMGVPIKYPASDCRLQILQDRASGACRLTAFMSDFELAEAMCTEITPEDTYEQLKSNDKGKKWGIKMSDVQFNLPSKLDDDDEQGKVRRRFTSLAESNDTNERGDIIVGFEEEAGE